MGNERLRQEIKDVKNSKEARGKVAKRINHPFWKTALILVSILHGLFLLRNQGYLADHSQVDLGPTLEFFIGSSLLIFAAVQVFALRYKKQKTWRLSIIGLSFIWTGLFVISLAYSFGIGRPNPAWYFYGFVAAGCFEISLSGGFYEWN